MTLKVWLFIFAVAFVQVDDAFAQREGRAKKNNGTRVRKTRVTCNPKHVHRSIGVLTRQVQAIQEHLEFILRSKGDTGIKQVRYMNGGTRPYHSATHASFSIAGMHDHTPNERTLGMGEIDLVMNGVEFRTRHNDYQMRMPHKNSTRFNHMQDVPFPPVPPSVLKHRGIWPQIAEMKEYFRAFKDQNITHRDYRPYFKPVLCYMEGSWTYSKGKIEEPFSSDRHALDASTWHDLNQKMRFTEYTGRKERLENYAYLPTKVFGVTNDTIPVPILAQWNYRIACHPLKDDLPLNRFRAIDDLSARSYGWKRLTLAEHKMSRNARFQLDPADLGLWNMERKARSGLLDKLMAQIPGKDNYLGNIRDEAFGETAYDINDKSKALNAAFYHRWFSTKMPGAAGTLIQARGYADENLFVALTSQDKVPAVNLTVCERLNPKKCTTWPQRVSYAFPLEIVYTTPLSKWNPWKLQYKGLAWSQEGRAVNAGGRTGGTHSRLAFNGTNSVYFFQTPAEFFLINGKKADPADTTPVKPVGVLDRWGHVRSVTASGHYIVMPDIPGVGKIRQRYPIMPVHGLGSSVWKELEAFKDYVADGN